MVLDKGSGTLANNKSKISIKKEKIKFADKTKLINVACFQLVEPQKK